MIAKNNLFLKEDIIYMKRALKLAKKGLYTTSPNPCVGCVIVKDNVILGEGYHKKAGLPHAEVNALLNCKENGNEDKIKGSTVYVTLEPCSHYGRTPPCALALVKHEVSRVVIAVLDPNPKVFGGGVKILEDANIEVCVGVLSDEAYALNKEFFKSIKTNRPYVIAKSAMSLDGKIANKDGLSKWITNEKSRNYAQKTRAFVDCILTSSKTVIDDNPRLNIRANTLNAKLQSVVRGEYFTAPLKIILDTNHSVCLDDKEIIKDGILYRIASTQSQYFKEQSKDSEFYASLTSFTLEQKECFLKKIKDNVYDVFLYTDKKEHLDLDLVLSYLNTLNVRRLLLECGSTLLSSFINENLVDEHLVFMSSKFLGKDGINAFFANNVKDVNKCNEYSIKSVKIFDNDIVIDYMR